MPLPLDAGTASAAVVRKKAESLRIPGIDFRQARLREAVGYLQRKSEERSKDGVNVVLLLGPADTAKSEEKVDFNAADISLWDAVHGVTSRLGLQVSAEPGALVIRVPRCSY